MWLRLSSLLLLCSLAHAEHLVGYYSSWSIYGRQFFVTEIDPTRLTHINYAFANIGNGEVVLGDPWADTEFPYPGDSWDEFPRGNFKQLNRLKTMNPALKTLISVGGWSWSSQFSDVALTPASRETFANSCAAFVIQWGFDGVDLDWEYPDGGGQGGNIERPEDADNFVLLCDRIRAKMDSLEVIHSRQFLLTMAAGSTISHIQSLNWPALMNSLDFVNAMCYDFSGAWSSFTYFNAPLFMDPANPYGEPAHTTLNTDGAIDLFLADGVLPGKLVVGMPFYGKGFANVNDTDNGLYQSFSGVPPFGTWEPGFFDYADLRDHYVNQNGYTRYYHPNSRVPYLHNPAANVFITYDDTASIREKCEYVLNENLAGAMFWELSADSDRALLTTAFLTFLNAPPLPAPQNLTITTLGDTLSFRWNAVPGAAHYTLWSSADPNALESEYTLELTTPNTQAALPITGNTMKLFFVRAE